MSKHLVRWGVVVTALLAVPGHHDEVDDQPQPVTATSDPLAMSTSDLATAYPDEFEYLRTTYRLSADEAADALQLTWTAGNTRAWAMAALPGYAGTWVDYEREAVYLGVAGSATELKVAQASITRSVVGDGVAPTTVIMPRTYRQLQADAARLQRVVDPENLHELQIEIDERVGSLHVVGMSFTEAAANPAVGRLLRASGYPTVRWYDATVADPADVPGGWNGAQGAGCTMAFTAVSPTNGRAVLTAGHCADNPVKTAGVTLSIAQYQRSFWPWLGGSVDTGYDRQLHVLPAGTTTVAKLQVPNVMITGSFLPAVGSVICRYGASSVAKGQPAAFCSTVTAYGYDGFVGMATGCIYGDSGGPSWVMGKAVGVAAVTTDPQWPVDNSSTCWMAPVKDQLHGTGYFLQDISTGPGATAGTDFSALGLFHPVGPTRVFDSRQSVRVNGQVDVGLGGAITAFDLGSAVLSVTVVPRGVAGYATVFPGDDGFVPNLYSVSYGPHSPESNLVISRVNRYMKTVRVYTSQSVDVIVDVLGYYSDTSGQPDAPGAVRVVPLPGNRVHDSRSTGIKLTPGASRDVQVSGVGGVPSTATAVVANLTVTQVTGSGWITAHAGGTAVTGTSNLNFVTGETKARLAIVPLDATGRLRITGGGSSTEAFIVDIQGYFEPTGTETAGRTFATNGGGGRILDTRTGTMMVPTAARCVDVYAPRTETANGLPRDGLLGVWLSVTVSDAAGYGWLVVAPEGTSPATSNLNFVPGMTSTNTVFVSLPSTTKGTVCFRIANTTAHVVADVIAMTVA
jgi:hypothetical protein